MGILTQRIWIFTQHNYLKQWARKFGLSLAGHSAATEVTFWRITLEESLFQKGRELANRLGTAGWLHRNGMFMAF